MKVQVQQFINQSRMQETIVLYPCPEIGHLVSMVELGKLILHHSNNSVKISILLITGPFLTPATSQYIRLVSETNPSISFHTFPPPLDLELDPPSPTWSPAARVFHYIRLNASNASRSLHQISKSCAIRAFVIDLFCTSALSLAKRLHIPTYYFYTSGAAALAAFLFLPTIHEHTTCSFKDMKDTLLHFPGLPPIKATQMVEPTLDRHDPAYHDMLYFCSHLPKSDGILVNTFQDLEPKAVDTLARGVCLPDSRMPPLYYLGPLLAQGREESMECLCLSWLDGQPSQSVVFLCFGSRGYFSPQQVKAIANGLEMSDQRFLWVVKNPHRREITEFELDSVLPDGFLERTKERGLVVKTWAPQVQVLRHESVGGFVTHCGWNSVLEAVVAGVPMVAWPLYAEQHMNKAFLVEHMEMAIPLEEKEEDGFVSAAELDRGLRQLMDSELGQQLRQRSGAMKHKALDARTESGSSTAALTNLLHLWTQGSQV